MSIVDLTFLFVFIVFYAALFYNLPVLAAGVHDLKSSKKKEHLRVESICKKGRNLPSFSVVLPVTNEKKVIYRLLEAVSHLDYPANKLEVVIVDDSSFDGTAEFCQRFVASHPNFMYFQRNMQLGKANALNFGLEKAKGEIIAVFDADNVPEKEVLFQAAKHFCDPKVVAVQGRISSINAQQNMLTQFVAYEDAVWCQAFLRGKEALGLFVHLRGCCQFIRRSILDNLGGFNENFLAEDVELSARIVKQGQRIKYAPEICAWQENPANIRELIKQRIRWYRGHMEVALKYGQLLQNLNRRTLDAELTLSLPFLTIASLFLFTFASWGVFSALPFSATLDILMVFSTFTTFILIFLAGFALIYVSKPKRMKNLLWLPFVLGYWWMQSFVAIYSALLILFRRPRRWIKTEKNGVVANPEFVARSLHESTGIKVCLNQRRRFRKSKQLCLERD